MRSVDRYGAEEEPAAPSGGGSPGGAGGGGAEAAVESPGQAMRYSPMFMRKPQLPPRGEPLRPTGLLRWRPPRYGSVRVLYVATAKGLALRQQANRLRIARIVRGVPRPVRWRITS